MMTTEYIRNQIRGLTAFEGIPEDQLECLLEDVNIKVLEDDEVLIVEGEIAQTAYLILDGDVEISRASGDGEVAVAVRHSGELVGEMALLMEARRNATVRARNSATVMEITADNFQSVLASRPKTAVSMLKTVWNRLQTAEAHLVQHQKMAALGTLAAGLAHELNNPASALVRTADQLADVITTWEQQATMLGSLAVSSNESDALDQIRETLSESEAFDNLDPLARADREEALQLWLEDHGVAESWKIASLLVENGSDIEDIEKFASQFHPDHLSTVIWWYAHGHLVQRLIRELSISGRAISEVVTAVKAYTRLDQAPIQEIDLHEGIDQALVILRHKLRGVKVVRDYAPELPPITVFAGEINQVWSNLIDNAASAMDGAGTLTIRTGLDSGDIVIDVKDTGPGIPKDAQDCIFDPFYTTKPPGEGTGIGLAITFNVVRKHGGDILLESKPGCTCFQVRLPVENGLK
jgi:signal transduction histidine kinase